MREFSYWSIAVDECWNLLGHCERLDTLEFMWPPPAAVCNLLSDLPSSTVTQLTISVTHADLILDILISEDVMGRILAQPKMSKLACLSLDYCYTAIDDEEPDLDSVELREEYSKQLSERWGSKGVEIELVEINDFDQDD